MCERERVRERERERACASVSERECACVIVCERERERECVCVCVSVRESVRVCFFVGQLLAVISMSVHHTASGQCFTGFWKEVIVNNECLTGIHFL